MPHNPTPTLETYQDFLARKRLLVAPAGKTVASADIHPLLFDFQRDLVAWALRKGRAALFADTGLGKTFMQIEWARGTGERSLIVAPLSVARQTVNEARKLDANVHYTRSSVDLTDGINITNYEMLDHFDPAAFGAVVLDESSILKALDGKTRQKLTDMFSETPFRLCCTATPAPNDIAEIGNHSEFLGIMPHHEMLASFFVHGDMGKGERQGWRLKGHAEEAFYRWLASWSMAVRTPSDIGYSDDGYILPALTITPTFVKTDYVPEGQLFFTDLKGIQQRNEVRKATMPERVAAVAEMVNGNNDQWIVWHGLNDEGYLLRGTIPDGVLVEGSHSPEYKAQAFEDFQDGKFRVLISKPSIAGMGMNFQNAHNMAFVGLSDSWEMYYQSIRRCYRFGQEHPVNVQIVLSDAEHDIYENVMRKEREAKRMQERLIEHVAGYEREELEGGYEDWQYMTDEVVTDDYRMMLGDSTERMAEITDDSIDMSVFSPPFWSLFVYSPSERDVGNSRNEAEFFEHFGIIIDHLLRVTKPGRLACVHVANVPTSLNRDGVIGLKDFRGQCIQEFINHGWVYHSEVTIDKNPQAQAIRTKAKGLLFVQKNKDRSWSRQALADYILVFRKPGENAIPIKSDDVSNDDWITWAHPVWYNIRESDTLNAKEAREEKDERHITPLQLETIERCIRLWSNPGDTVLSPFAGIGSEGYVAIQQGRKFVGIELKRSYYEAAVNNLRRAQAGAQLPLFAELEQAS